VLDGAGWHASSKVRVSEGMHLVRLPPYSPELQPAERLWPFLREVVADKDIADMDELEDLLEHRCRELSRDHEVIHASTLFQWWSHAAEAENLG
jgi:transposase